MSHATTPQGPEQVFARVERVAQTASTNTALREAAIADPAAWPHLSVLVADHQTAGRGRAERTWVTPRAAALTASVLIRPRVPLDRVAWLTLLTGLAVVRAVNADQPDQAAWRSGLKWPNDILLTDVGSPLEGWGTGRKLGGILTELTTTPPDATPDGRPAVVVGIGLNLTQETDELPVAWATSFVAAGLPVPARDGLLAAVGRELAAVVARWEAHDGDAPAAGLRDEVSAVCLSLGAQVRVERPGGEPLTGLAVAIDDHGRLLVRDISGREHAVLAGDVLHVRDAGEATPGAWG